MAKRDRILEKSGGKCFYCGCDLSGQKWHVDHFYPVVRIGNGEMIYPALDTEINMVPSCAPCNNFKSSSDVEGMRFRVAEQLVNVPKSSMGMRQLMRLGLAEIHERPIIFWFEKNGIAMPSRNEIIGVSDEAAGVEWKRDSDESCLYAEVGRFIVSLREYQSHALAIATAKDWEQYRIELPLGGDCKSIAAQWAIDMQ